MAERFRILRDPDVLGVGLSALHGGVGGEPSNKDRNTEEASLFCPASLVRVSLVLVSLLSILLLVVQDCNKGVRSWE